MLSPSFTPQSLRVCLGAVANSTDSLMKIKSSYSHIKQIGHRTDDPDIIAVSRVDVCQIDGQAAKKSHSIVYWDAGRL